MVYFPPRLHNIYNIINTIFSMEDKFLIRSVIISILVVLVALSFFILKPLLMAIIVGLILGFIFYPVYTFILKHTNSANFSATIVCILLGILIIIPTWFFAPILLQQSFQIYNLSNNFDAVGPLKAIFPGLFSVEGFSNELSTVIRSSISKMSIGLVNMVSDFIINLPEIALQFLVVLFVFFFFLTDRKIFVDYIGSVLPFSKDVEKELFKQTHEITLSVLYGQILLGFAEGLIVAAGFYLFGVPNALFLSILVCLAGVIPIVGTILIWLPVIIYLLAVGSIFSAIGVTVFSLLSVIPSNLIRPMLIARRTSMHPAIALIGMLGGAIFFGIIGFILGPLILAYLIILVEIYRNKRTPSPLLQQEIAN